MSTRNFGKRPSSKTTPMHMNKNHGEMAFLPERKNEKMAKSD